jgi:hypothetical protein
MDIYDPIAEALNVSPLLQEIVLPTLETSDAITPWNKGLKGLPNPRKGKKYGKQKRPKKSLSEIHKAKLKGINLKLKKYSNDRSKEHLDKIRKAATKQTTCIYCSKVAAQISIARWHNENCKHK